MSCNAGFWKASKVLPEWMCIPNMNLIKKIFFIYRLNGACVMNVPRKRVKNCQNIILRLLQNPWLVSISALSAPTLLHWKALAWKMASGMTKLWKSVIGSICTYSLSCDAGFRKRPKSCPNECVSQIWNRLKKYLFIYRINGAFLMNVARKRAKQSLKIEFCDYRKTWDLC